MSNYSRDSIVNVIQQQIKEPIKMCIQHGYYSAGVKLIYTGIDTMAFLSMPSSKTSVTKSDFISWVDQYIHFEGREQLTGLDVYGARCSMLHNHSAHSELSRKGLCRWIGYVDQMSPPIAYNPTVEKKLVMVSISAFANVFFAGIDKSLIDLFVDSAKGKIAAQRLNDMVHNFPYRDIESKLREVSD